MEVKFTNPKNAKEVLFGVIKEKTFNVFAVVSDAGKEYVINPNSDYNFGFVWNEEAERGYQEMAEKRFYEDETLS
jgi:hypothetical protein